jgi:hypothetical protein
MHNKIHYVLILILCATEAASLSSLRPHAYSAFVSGSRYDIASTSSDGRRFLGLRCQSQASEQIQTPDSIGDVKVVRGLKTCRVCKQTYFESDNHPRACR